MSNSAQAAFGFPRSLRLIKTSDYGVLVHVRNENTFRVASKYFSANALKFVEHPGRIRFGITVGKKNAHRSVDRALVKRILREAARQQAPDLVARLSELGVGLDVSLRLRVPLNSVPGRDQGVRALRAELGRDAELLVSQVSRRLNRRTPEKKEG